MPDEPSIKTFGVAIGIVVVFFELFPQCNLQLLFQSSVRFKRLFKYFSKAQFFWINKIELITDDPIWVIWLPGEYFWVVVSSRQFVMRWIPDTCNLNPSKRSFMQTFTLRPSCVVHIMRSPISLDVGRIFERGFRIGDSRHPR